MQVAIFDLDNCLANDNWRLHHIRAELPNEHPAKFEQYHILSPFDRMYMHANNKLYNHLRAGHKIVINTSRPEKFRLSTEYWLQTYRIYPQQILMRPDGDNTESKVLKIKNLVNSDIRIDDIIVAYDDRFDVLDAYDSAGINAERLAIHEQP